MAKKTTSTTSTILDGNETHSIPTKLSVLPLRDMIVYPHMIFPALIGRAHSIRAAAVALERGKFIFLTAQKDATQDDPSATDLYEDGTIARILQIVRLPNNLMKVLVEGLFQGKIESISRTEDYFEAEVSVVHISTADADKEHTAAQRRVTELFGDYVRNNRNLPPEVLAAFEAIDDPARKLYYACGNIQHKLEGKQEIMTKRTLKDQYTHLAAMLASETELLKLENELDVRVHDNIQKQQRKYFIQEQIRTLQKELGEDEEESVPELAALKEAIEKAEMPEAAHAKAMEEFDRLKRTPSMSPEFSVNRNYIEWLTQLPWTTSTTDQLNIDHVKKVLDDDHFDLEKPKQRIIEYISVLNLVGSIRGQILCLVGPPGVGKTSLAKSIAGALGRKFVRISLGGVRDEAEIRGHRKTYIGSMPGKILQSMKRASTVNPVILLDEIDKMSMDFRGDPSSALLEVLDPEQNIAFNDHYLEVDYDLSKVLFIATANTMFDIPGPLLDRMEVIELQSYLDPDKVQIAQRHILPKLLKEHGLDKFKIKFEDAALLKICREYTRESGVRNMERELASILRKVAQGVVQELTKDLPVEAVPADATAEGEVPMAKVLQKLTDLPAFKKIAKRAITITTTTVEQSLRVPRYKEKPYELTAKVGMATGLAWTSVGGETLPVEVTIMPGTEKLTLTGKLGDVMKESAMAALSYVRSSWSELGVPENFSKDKEIHIHVPEGAVPKDGPSAGITMTLALVSAAANKPLRGDVAMTGEVTLRGNVMAIGGLNEKLLAAKRVGIRTVLVPKDNEKDVSEIKPAVKEGMNLIFVQHIREALPVVFNSSASGNG